MSFGQRLRGFRRVAGMTIEELSEKSGVSARAISDMERGHSRAPQARTLEALAVALGLTYTERAEVTELARSGRSDVKTGRPRVGELPRGVSDFVGREPETALLLECASGTSADGPAAVALIHGQAGIGKTALAIRAAERLRDRFPDGQSYLDLRGIDESPMASGEALTRALRALEVDPRAIADDEQERAAQLRALMRERNCLMVLDNVANEAQVRPLLPGPGPGMTIVTSRRALGGLEGVLRLALSPLAPAEAAHLLRFIAAREAADDETESVAAMCGNLPLALRIAGTRLASRPGWTMGHLAQRLSDADRRLANLSTGDTSVEAAFALSYAQLSTPAKAMFRRLAHVPGPDFDAALAAVLTAPGEVDRESVYAAEDLLDDLVDLGLLQTEGPDRYRFHDLIRLFARQRLTLEEPADTRAATAERMVDWLLETAIVAGRWFEPGYGKLPEDWHGLVALDSTDQAHTWLLTELENWLAAFRRAAGSGRDQLVVDVAEAMHWFSDRVVELPCWRDVYLTSRRAASRLPDRRQEVAHINYASWAVSITRTDFDLSAELALEAYRLAVELGDLKEQASSLNYAGQARRMNGELDLALDFYRRAFALSAEAGDHDQHVQFGCAVGVTLRLLGRFDESLDVLHTVLRAVGERPVSAAPALVARASAHSGIISALVDAGRWQEAIDREDVAIEAVTEFGGRLFLGAVTAALGRAYAGLGDIETARDHLTRGLELLKDGNGSPLSIQLAETALERLIRADRFTV